MFDAGPSVSVAVSLPPNEIFCPVAPACVNLAKVKITTTRTTKACNGNSARGCKCCCTSAITN
jgi:hypothetical protein